eukprot:m.134391 g.134391  ORF g.134391 m.134391 type:complete len:439 (+) comp14693_c0_seq8:22-1338(+)
MAMLAFVFIVALLLQDSGGQQEYFGNQWDQETIYADEDHIKWGQALKEEYNRTDPYPEGRFSGRGIVTSAGGRSYFTSVYVTIRVLREIVKCDLPIEVVYHGAEELPKSAMDHMNKLYDVNFVDLTAIEELKGINLKGYQIKAFAIYISSFEEVLWLDSDNLPVADPSFLFQDSRYLEHGSLFWGDYCNMVSMRRETFSVFQQHTPAAQPQPRPGKRTIWPRTCQPGVQKELETGEIVFNKKKAWDPLRMILFINKNHQYFLQKLFQGDKMTFHFGFMAANRTYGISPFLPHALGIQDQVKGDKFFCGNTMGQRHPEDGSILFLHRTVSKYKVTHPFTTKGVNRRGWKYMASQPELSGWEMFYRDELPASFFLGKSTADQYECVHPIGPGLKVVKAASHIIALEKKCLEFLQDLENLPFYPGKDLDCSGEARFFCKHP